MKTFFNYARDYRTSYRVLVHIMIVSSFFTIGSTGLQLYLDYQRDIGKINEGIHYIKKGYLESITSNLWAFDNKQIKKNLEGALTLPDIQYLEVKEIGKNYAQILESAGENRPGNVISKTFELRFGKNNKLIGELLVVASKDAAIDRLKEKVLVILATQTLKTFFVSIAILFIFYILVMRHLNFLARYFMDFSLERLNEPLSIKRRNEPEHPDEFKRLIQSINLMRSSLHQNVNILNQTIQDLKESESRWRSLTETSPDQIIILDNNLKIEFTNFAPPGQNVNDLIGTPFLQNVESREKQKEIKSVLNRVLETGELSSFETVYRTVDGNEEYFESRVVPRRLGHDQHIIGLTVSSRNITDRKLTEKEFLKNQYYLAKAQEIGIMGTWELEVAENKLTWTKQNYKIFGLPVGTRLSFNTFLDCVHPEDKDYVKDKWNAGLTQDQFDFEHRLLVDGEVKWVREKADVEYDKNGTPIQAIGFTQDITFFKQVEEKIKSSLLEKETLLQEIHHRVKNNMQVIASLLKLQLNRDEKQDVNGILKENIGRVYAMSAIHESLYRSEQLSSINFETYLKKISQMLSQTYTVDQSKVAFQIRVSNLTLPIEIANPLGLVMNELISNSLKYAFPEQQNGVISISSEKHNNCHIDLVVADDGIGISEAFDWKNSNTLGLHLVQNLVENQLNGSMDLDVTNGTKFTIRFDLKSDYA